MLPKLRVLSATLGLLAVVSFPAEPADDLKPPSGYRKWFHVNTMVVDKGSPLFADLGGMHNIYINSAGEAALKKGGPYPNKTMFVTDLHEFTVSDGSYVEGARKALAVMLKDLKEICIDRRLAASAAVGDTLPCKRRRDIFALAGVLGGDVTILFERG